jgi:hypothetical protein
MVDGASGLSAAVVDSRSAPGTDDAVGTPARELAQRRSGEIDVLLLWHPELDRVELCVLDLATGVSVHVDIAPDKALDAFYHPYAYVTRRKSAAAQLPFAGEDA